MGIANETEAREPLEKRVKGCVRIQVLSSQHQLLLDSLEVWSCAPLVVFIKHILTALSTVNT